MERLKNLMLYIAHRCESDERFSATKLNKILFMIDFAAYALQGKPVTESSYIHLQYGPVPKTLVEARNALINSGLATLEIRPYFGHNQKRLKALAAPNLEMFSADELTLIDRTIETCMPFNASDLSEMHHTFRPWKLTRMNEEIPFPTIFTLHDAPVTLDDIEWGIQRVKDLGLV